MKPSCSSTTGQVPDVMGVHQPCGVAASVIRASDDELSGHDLGHACGVDVEVLDERSPNEVAFAQEPDESTGLGQPGSSLPIADQSLGAERPRPPRQVVAPKDGAAMDSTP